MEAIWRNVRQGFRVLRRGKGATVVMLLSLAFGIGATTAIFSIVQGILLKPLPYPESNEIVRLWESNPSQGMDQFSVSPPNFLDWKEQNQVFENMAAFSAGSMSLTGSGEAERLRGLEASSELIPLLGVPPLLGRAFSAQETEPGRGNVAILSFGLWQRRFAGDEAILGKTIRLDGEEKTIIGVMPAGFAFPSDQTEILVPFTFDERSLSNRGAKWIGVIARMKPQIDLAQAQENMNLVATALTKQYPEKNKGWGVLVESLQESVIGDMRKTVLILFAAVCVVLIIACANVASLLMAENAARQQEIAIRTALGAKPNHILFQLLSESVLLSLIGGLFGVVLALWTKDTLLFWAEKFLPRVNEISINYSVLIFALVVSVLTGILFGLLPALQLLRPAQAIRSGSSRFTQRGTRSLFVIGEVALAVVLLSGAGLLIRSLHGLLDVSPGFDPNNLLRFTVENPDSRYPEDSHVATFHASLLERLKSVPDVHDVAAASVLPLTGEDWSHSINIKGRELPEEDQASVQYRVVTADYFKTMKIPLRDGRFFSQYDRRGTQLVSVVNEAFSRQFFPAGDAIGQLVQIGDRVPEFRQVIGIAGDVKDFGLSSGSVPVIYVSLSQKPLDYMNYVLRTTGNPTGVAPAIRQIVRSLDPEMPIFGLGTMQEVVSDSVSRQRFLTYLLAFFAATALVLALFGLYGLLSYSVSRRTREIGLRMAMGARGLDVLRLILSSGIRLTLIGLVLGFAATFATGKVLTTFLFEITPNDPKTLAFVFISLVLVALFAMFIPARRASRVNPLEALRYE